ncbi:hypothetical protein BKA93DRAFT_130622 [Sparassis latifolia]
MFRLALTSSAHGDTRALFETWSTLIVPRNEWISYLPLGSASCVDIVIAVSLCYLLSRCKTGFRSMDSMIKLVMLYTINTGMITAICAVTSIVMVAALPNSLWMISFSFVLGKLYVNCFLAMLNARNALHSRNSADPTFISSLKLQSQAPTPSSPSTSIAPLPLALLRPTLTSHVDISFVDVEKNEREVIASSVSNSECQQRGGSISFTDDPRQ